MYRNKLKKLRSDYILKYIFEYIKDPNFKYKLFAYSKLFQKKVDLKLVDYQEEYIYKIFGRVWEFFFTYIFNGEEVKNDYNLLKNQFSYFISENHIDFDILISSAINYYEKYWKKNRSRLNDNNNIQNSNIFEIDIYSPFFYYFSKKDFFKEIFIIRLPLNQIEMFNLKEDYFSVFDELNKANFKYSSISIEFESINNIKCLKQMNINFGRITKLYLHQIIQNYTINYDEIYERFFKLFNTKVNLAFLYLEMIYSSNNELLINSFKTLNLFHSLVNTYFCNIKLRYIFEIDLPNLKIVSFTNCKNIIFSKNTCKTIKKLTLKMFTFSKLEILC